RMFLNLLDFGDLDVSDLMVHRSDVVAVADDVTLTDLRRVIAESGHSRVLVYRDSLDTVLGLIHAKDLVQYLYDEERFELNQILRPIFAVPPGIMAVDLLARMRSSGMHLALVVDEYGGTDGIV